MAILLTPLAALATLATGLLAGASLDQSIKQLPARRRIGAVAYAAYAGAADLGNGVVWYASLGVGAALLCVLTALAARAAHLAGTGATACWLSAALAIAHSLTTAKAAPIMFSSRKLLGDPAALSKIFDRFALWQGLRAALQLVNFMAALWSLLSTWRL